MQANVAFPRFEKLEPTLRHRILDAAAKEFGRFGYGAASMNRLVKGAGISKGAIFKYFGTKAGLFGYVYQSALDEVKDVLRKARDESSGDPFFTRLEQVLRTGIDFTRSKPLSAAIYYRVIYTGDAPHGNSMLTQIQDTSRRFLRGMLEDGVKAGDLRRDMDTGKAAFILQSVLDRFLQSHYLEFMTPEIELSSLNEGSRTNSDSDVWIHEITELFRCGMEIKR